MKKDRGTLALVHPSSFILPPFGVARLGSPGLPVARRPRPDRGSGRHGREQEGDLGQLEIYDPTGARVDTTGRPRIALCRCGGSVTKPFCDGTHKRCGFQSMLVAFALPPPAPKPAP